MQLPKLSLVLFSSALAPCQDLQFQRDGHRAAAVFLPAGLTAFTCGDVDRDGLLDVVGTRLEPLFQTTHIVVHRRAGGGWQQTTLHSIPMPSTGVPRGEPMLSDLDADNDLDLLAVLTFPSLTPTTQVLQFRNDGSGGFALVAALSWAGASAVSVATGDVDGDGDLDLVVARRDASGQPLPPILYRHDGAFGFQEVPGALPATPATGVAFADLDGDGDQDLVAIAASGQVLGWSNVGGAFAGAAIGTGPALHFVAADFDGDGDNDVLVQGPDGAVSLLRNTPNGFAAQATTPGGAAAGGRPQAGDVDGDGAVDVAIQVDGELRVLRNDGAANFAPEAIAGAGSFAVGDTDGDGRLDVVFQIGASGLAAAHGSAGRMIVDAALGRRPHVAHADAGTTVTASDLDRDGRVDWIQQAEHRILVRRNLGVGAWSTIVLPTPMLRPQVQAMDVDGDGDEDLVAVDSSATGGLQVFRLDPGFVFTALPHQNLPAALLAGAGDLDRDGRVDLVIGVGTTLQLLRSNGGAFAAPVTLFQGVPSGFRPGIWDMDGDGDLDLVVVAGFPSCGMLLTNDGNGNFSAPGPCVITAPPGWSSLERMQLVDIDGDGDADLFTWGYGRGMMLMNQGGTFVPGQLIQGVFGSSLLKPLFADWDDDGDLDLLQLGGPAQLWLNAGTGRLVDATATRIGWTEFQSSVAADLDGDGDPEPLGVFGTHQRHQQNHLRSATSLSVPVPGGQIQVRFAHEPGFATTSTTCLPILAFQPRVAPLRVPGIRGTWQLDPGTAAVLPLMTLAAPAGTAVLSVSVPLRTVFVGLDVYAQGLLLGAMPAFTPAIHERILP